MDARIISYFFYLSSPSISRLGRGTLPESHVLPPPLLTPFFLPRAEDVLTDSIPVGNRFPFAMARLARLRIEAALVAVAVFLCAFEQVISAHNAVRSPQFYGRQFA